MTSHFSLNIKTLSKQTNAMVLSIALVKFTATTIEEKLHIALDLNQQQGRDIETDRFHWWLNEYQNRPNMRPFPQEKFEVRSAIRCLNNFILQHGSIPDLPNVPVNFMWCRGTQFDWAILENLSHEFSTGLIFRHNALRCQRTFCDDYVKHEPVKVREALHDAMYHANQIQQVLKIKNEPLK